jgi:hypothetical protein
MFRKLLNENNDTGQVYNGGYGMVGTWTMVIPLIRHAIHRPLIYTLKERIEELSRDYEKVIIMAHSNGTHIVARALEKADEIWDNIYLCLFGGTLHCSYDFKRMYRKVRAVFNFCSTSDRVIQWLPLLISRGNSGYWGFRHRDGTKADVNINFEGVWCPITESDRFPYVFNIHANGQKHSDWVSKGWANYAINEVLKFIRHEKICARNIKH